MRNTRKQQQTEPTKGPSFTELTDSRGKKKSKLYSAKCYTETKGKGEEELGDRRHVAILPKEMCFEDRTEGGG